MRTLAASEHGAAVLRRRNGSRSRTGHARLIDVNQRGFTLIELLVVLVIMGLLAGLASLSVGGSAHRQALDEAERFAEVVGFVSDEAVMQGEEYGLVLAEDSYSVLRFDPESERWSEATDRQLARHELPVGVRLEVRLDEDLQLPRRGRSTGGGANDEQQPVPGILVLSSGEISPFEIGFHSGNDTDVAALIRSDGSGKLAQE